MATGESQERAGVRTLRSSAEIDAIGDPLRLDLLQLFGTRPRTPKQAAEALGVPPTRVYHHVGVLEDAGLVEVVETRPKRGAVEKYYAATATSFRLDPAIVRGAGKPGSARAVVAGVLEGALADVHAALPDDAPLESCRLPALVARAAIEVDPARVEDLASELKALLERFSAGSGTPYRITLVGVPVPEKVAE